MLTTGAFLLARGGDLVLCSESPGLPTVGFVLAVVTFGVWPRFRLLGVVVALLASACGSTADTADPVATTDSSISTSLDPECDPASVVGIVDDAIGAARLVSADKPWSAPGLDSPFAARTAAAE